MIKTQHFQARIIEPGIIENIIFEKTAVDVDLAKEMKIANLSLANETEYAVLVLAEPMTSISPEARTYIASEYYQKITLAKAILVGSLAQRIITNFYMRFNKPKTPTSSFNNRDEALKWLRSFLKKEELATKK